MGEGNERKSLQDEITNFLKMKCYKPLRGRLVAHICTVALVNSVGIRFFFFFFFSSEKFLG